MNFKRRRAWPGMLALLCLIASFILPVTLPGMEGQAYAATGPDLVIQSIIWSPQTPSLGDQTRFTITISNHGDDIAGSSRLLFYIDDHIIDSTFISQIPASSMLDYIFTWKATAGEHVVKVAADSEEAVTESDENNNEKSYAFSVLAPDLTATSITWAPERPSMGDPVTFTVTFHNQGNKAANTHWIEFLIDGVSRGQREGQQLNPGASYTRTYSWVAQPGQHILKASIDVLSQSAESDETNNDLTVVYSTTPPDLVIESLTWTPATRTESGNVTMSIKVKNQGEGAANGSRLDYYIDGNIQTSVYNGPLEPGASVIRTYNWHPGPEEHIFLVTIDNDNWILEGDESNNTRSVTISALGLPDLTIQSVTWTPSVPTINSRVIFSITIKNEGTRTVPKCDLALYITGGVRITRQPGPIAPGATVNIELQWITGTVSANARVAIDENNYITESNETNNEKAFSLTPVKLLPTADLTIQSVTCTPSAPAHGDTVSIKAVIKNQGSSISESSSASVYIDNEHIGDIFFEQLHAGQSAEKDIKWKAVTGEHQVKIIIDVSNSISEINETNNEATTTITTSDPDLAIEKIEWFPIYPEIGKDVLFTLTIKNQGTRVSGQCYITYHIDGSKQGEHYLEPIEPGASVTRNFSWNMQATTQTFLAVIDEANAVIESDESNNEKSVYLPAPDLTIKSITCSDDYPVPDTLLSFTIDIANTGGSQAAMTRTAGYIDGLALAQVDLNAINAGESAESVFYWTAVPGRHTLRVVADEEDAVTESSESDNAKEIIVFVPLASGNMNEEPEVSDNTSAAVPATQEPEETVAPTLSEEEINELLGNTEPEVTTETTPDIADNISATPVEGSGGIKDILLNKWLIFGVAGAGIACIGVLLFLRKRSGQPKKEKAPKAPKPPKPPKAAKPAKPAKPDKKNVKPQKPVAKPVLPGTTLSGKPPVFVPPPPKPSAAPGGLSAPIKITPPPLPKPAVPPPSPNLGTTLIQQQAKQPPPAPPNPPPKA